MTLPDPGEVDIESLLRETPQISQQDLLQLENGEETMEYIKRRGGYVELPANSRGLTGVVKCPCLARDSYCGIREITDNQGRTRRICTKPLWKEKNWKRFLMEQAGATDECPYAADRPGLEL